MPHMTPKERIFTALSHREADRVPFVLALTLHGAKELGLTIRQYFSSAANVVEAQIRMQQRYGHDALIGFRYAAAEYEAWGGEAIFVEDGPPNSGEPIFKNLEALDHLEVPRIEACPELQTSLEIIRQLKSRAGNGIPILGVVLSPFSLPVMQLGFDLYLDLLYGDRERFWLLMAANQVFATAWANAQLEAGATALAYYDPLASPSMIPMDLYRETGFKVACDTLKQISGPTITNLASGSTLGVIDLIAQTGTQAIGVSSLEDLVELKSRCAGRLGVVGNLNGLAMVRWTAKETEQAVREALVKGAPGGGFVLSDNHGELPWGVPDEVIGTLAETVRTWGQYPAGSDHA